MSAPRALSPLATKETDPSGNRHYVWENGAQVSCFLAAVTTRHKYPVRASYGGVEVGTATVDMLDLADRERLQAHCGYLDGKVNWVACFNDVAEDLRVLRTGEAQRELMVTPLNTVTPERAAYWWKPYLPKGRPVSLEGDPNVGKSTLVIKIVAHMTTGEAFPNVLGGEQPQSFAPRNVCLLTSEDAPADTIRPRVEVNDGDPARVFLIDGWRHGTSAQHIVTMQDLDILKVALETYYPALLVFDPVQSFFGRGVDMNSAADTRPVLDAVANLCYDYRCTPLYVRHIGKARRDKAIHAGLGSIDIAANMRSVLLLGEDPDQKNRRIMAHAKSNNAALGISLVYRITSVERDLFTPAGEMITVEAPRLDWDGQSSLTALDLLASPSEEHEDQTALASARTFLQELLEDQPLTADEVKKAGREAGISIATLRRARDSAGVDGRKRKIAGKHPRDCPWEWYLVETDVKPGTPAEP